MSEVKMTKEFKMKAFTSQAELLEFMNRAEKNVPVSILPNGKEGYLLFYCQLNFAMDKAEPIEIKP